MGGYNLAKRAVVATAVLIAAVAMMPTASAQDPAIRSAQEQLLERGYEPGPADGFSGPRTVSAIEAFQRDQDLVVSGELDHQTVARLSAPSVAPALLPNIDYETSAAPSAKAPSLPAEGAWTAFGLLVAIAAVGSIWFARRSQRRAMSSGSSSMTESRAAINSHLSPTREAVAAAFKRDPEKPTSSPHSVVRSSSDRFRLINTRDLEDTARNVSNQALSSPQAVDRSSAERFRLKNARELESDAARQTPHRPDREVLSSDPKSGWVPKGASRKVAGREIGGMVYVGVAPRLDGYGTRSGAFIDPSLSVARRGDDFAGEGMGYWPKYHEITATSRATYLDWLASGRSDTRANVGYMFLYFYGLERRFFKESPDTEEKTQILDEVDRLLGLFGSNHSAHRYLSAFLDIGRVLQAEGDLEPIFDHKGFDLPLSLSVALGLRVANGENIPSDWALSWLLCHPERQLRTPARRCAPEFRAVFEQIFADRYPKGLPVRRPKRELTPSYQAASGEFSATITMSDAQGSLPDVSGLKTPVRAIQVVADEAMDALDKYSRLLGRNPEGRGTLEGLALLPPSIRPLYGSADIERLRAWAGETVKQGGVSLGDLLVRLEGNRPEKVTRRHLTGAADALALIGYGLAPDPRYALRPPKINEPVILFPLPEGYDLADGASDAYKAALLELGLAALIAHADGTIAPAEKTALAETIHGNTQLDEHERARLQANLDWLLSVPPDFSLFRKRLKEAANGEVAVVRRIIVAIANADGVIHRDEIASIEKIYRVMGLDPSEVYSDLHVGAMADEPVSVRPAVSAPAGETIPPETSNRTGIVLDRSRIAEISRQTEQASKVLGSILGGDEADDENLALQEEETSIFDGLDPKHASLATELLERPHWAEDEIAALAARRGLMMQGGLEAINEWAFKHFDDALIEEYDGYDVNGAIAEALKERMAEHP